MSRTSEILDAAIAREMKGSREVPEELVAAAIILTQTSITAMAVEGGMLESPYYESVKHDFEQLMKMLAPMSLRRNPEAMGQMMDALRRDLADKRAER